MEEKTKTSRKRQGHLYCLINCHIPIDYNDGCMIRAMLTTPSYYFKYFESREAFQSEYQRRAGSIQDHRQYGIIPTMLIKEADTWGLKRKTVSYEMNPQEKIEGYILYQRRWGEGLTESYSLEGLLQEFDKVSKENGFFQAFAVLDLKQEGGD